MSLLQRLGSLARGRTWAGLFFEVVLIILGVLVALAIDGAAEDRRDRIAEAEYLELLERDLTRTVEQLETVREAADLTVRSGLEAYRELSREDGTADRTVIASGVSAMTGRLTVRPFEATYRELLSTGNLSLIQDRELRDEIVTYHETAELNYETFARNRTFFNDEVFALFVIEEALLTPYVRPHPVPVVSEVVSGLINSLGDDFEPPPERINDLTPGTDVWNQLRIRSWSTIVTTQFLADTAGRMQSEAEVLRERIRLEIDAGR